MTAYQIISIMEGVVQRGTAAVAGVGKPIAGKTGTTNDEKDAWFVGFTPDLAVGVYMGYDKPRHLGQDATGGHLSAPIVRDFFKAALADQPASVPRAARHQLIPVDFKTGQRAAPGNPGAILEAFKAGTAPPDSRRRAGAGRRAATAPKPSADSLRSHQRSVLRRQRGPARSAAGARLPRGGCA